MIGRTLLLAGTAAALMTAAVPPRAAEERLANPYAGDAEAIEDGRRIYRTRCFICHLHSGGRGPNLFRTRLDDEAFLDTVINGRATMPAFGLKMSPDEVWRVHAFIKSTDRY